MPHVLHPRIPCITHFHRIDAHYVGDDVLQFAILYLVESDPVLSREYLPILLALLV